MIYENSNTPPSRRIIYPKPERLPGAPKHPDCPSEGLFGKNVHVQAALLKFRDRLPLRKTAETMNRSYGLEVSPATVLGILHRVARWLRPEYIWVKERIRSAGVVYVDEIWG